MAATKAKSIETRIKFDDAVDLISRTQVAITAVKAKRDKEIQSVNERYKDELEPLEDKRDLYLKLAEGYAEENRDALFPKGIKSAETTHAIFGFKIGNPTMKALSKKWTVEKILEALKASYGSRFIRTKEEHDKEKLRAELSNGELAEVGLRVEQEDRFYVEPKVETGERVTA